MKQYSIFISHSWAYSKAYTQLVNMLDNDPRFNYKNYSVPKDNPVHNAGTDRELAEAIRQRVSFCDVVVILAGKYSTHSKWIKKEIVIAQSFSTPKSILAIEPWASSQTSQIVKSSADRIVKWNTVPIVAAIRELS
jgi:hypothetical protein